MKENNLIQLKSYGFALEIISVYKSLVSREKEFVLSKQLLRSGTSIGANIEEAIGAQTRKDFFSKITISYKEARESHYWIRLLFDAEYIKQEEKTTLLELNDEILRIIGSIQRTLRNS